MALYEKPYENIVGKGENAGKLAFLVFSMFLTLPQKNFSFSVTFYSVVCKCCQFGPVRRFVI